MLREILGSVAVFWAAPILLGAQMAEVTVALEPFATGKSPLFELKTGERLEVTVAPDSIAADVFVHAEDKSLLARDDPESPKWPFEWTCPRPGNYYVTVRNVTETAGSAKVRRLPPSPTSRAVTPANYSRVRLYYATDRQKTAPTATPPLFGTEPSPGNALSYGQCEVSIPREHEMGELEGPSIWRLEFRQDPERHVVLLRETVRDLNRAAFLRAVEEKVSTSKDREVLVFIHGFNTTFEDAARRTAQISYDLGFRGAPILYSWPSQGSVSPAAYLKDGSNAELSVQALQGLLDDLRLRAGARTIHLVAHSMGNRLLTNALAGLAAKGPLSPKFRHVAFMAPDVRTESFKQLAERFRSTAERLTLYASSKDGALVASQKLNGYARAGQGGSGIVVMDGLDSVDASTVDTSLLGIGHQYYGDSRSVLGDLFQVMQGKRPDERFGLKKAASGRYWEIK